MNLVSGLSLMDGKYTLDSELGAGGMSVVWNATQHTSDGGQQKVVLKFLLPEIQKDPEMKVRFFEEALLAMQLRHPHIVRIHAVEEWDTYIFIVMERVWGRALAEVLEFAEQKGERVPWFIAVRLVIMVAEALHYASTETSDDGRALELVHRDIKPANLLFTTGGEIKIIDFGVAKTSTSQLKTQTGVVKGTIAYMSPEQLKSEKLDVRSDLFSLGAVLYELCTGKRPFVGDNFASLMLSILTSPPFGIEGARKELPGPLCDMFLRVMDKDPNQRPVDARAFSRELERLLSDYSREELREATRDYFEYIFPDLMDEWNRHRKTLRKNRLFQTGELPKPEEIARRRGMLATGEMIQGTMQYNPKPRSATGDVRLSEHSGVILSIQPDVEALPGKATRPETGAVVPEISSSQLQGAAVASVDSNSGFRPSLQGAPEQKPRGGTVQIQSPHAIAPVIEVTSLPMKATGSEQFQLPADFDVERLEQAQTVLPQLSSSPHVVAPGKNSGKQSVLVGVSVFLGALLVAAVVILVVVSLSRKKKEPIAERPTPLVQKKVAKVAMTKSPAKKGVDTKLGVAPKMESAKKVSGPSSLRQSPSNVPKGRTLAPSQRERVPSQRESKRTSLRRERRKRQEELRRKRAEAKRKRAEELQRKRAEELQRKRAEELQRKRAEEKKRREVMAKRARTTVIPIRTRPRTVVKVARVEKTKPPPVRAQRIRLKITPSCLVYWRGKKLGYTPQATMFAKPGRHTISCRNPNKKIQALLTVRVRPGMTTFVQTLRKGTLRIYASPFGKVSMPGFGSLGNTPLKLSLYEGLYRVKVTSPATGVSKKYKIRLKPGQVQKIKVQW